MTITSLYPLLTTPSVSESAAFFAEHFPFEVTFESDWFVSLRTGDGRWELALIEPGHESVPAGWRDATAQGVIVTVEVEDVDAVHASMAAAGLPMHVALCSEPTGQRHFITADPTGILVDVITPIPPDDAYASGYADA